MRHLALITGAALLTGCAGGQLNIRGTGSAAELVARMQQVWTQPAPAPTQPEAEQPAPKTEPKLPPRAQSRPAPPLNIRVRDAAEPPPQPARRVAQTPAKSAAASGPVPQAVPVPAGAPGASTERVTPSAPMPAPAAAAVAAVEPAPTPLQSVVAPVAVAQATPVPTAPTEHLAAEWITGTEARGRGFNIAAAKPVPAPPTEARQQWVVDAGKAIAARLSKHGTVLIAIHQLNRADEDAVVDLAIELHSATARAGGRGRIVYVPVPGETGDLLNRRVRFVLPK